MANNERFCKVQISFSEKQVLQLKEIARETGNTASAVVRMILEEYFFLRNKRLDEALKERARFKYIKYAQDWYNKSMHVEEAPAVPLPGATVPTAAPAKPAAPVVRPVTPPPAKETASA